MDINVLEILTNLFIYGIPAVLAITLHEAAHGYAALQKGDPTAKQLGRLSLNPIRHVDPLGTLFLPAALIFAGSPFVFGYAKPVPVNFRNLRNPRLDMVYVALAGPATNIILAFASALLLHTMALVPVTLVPILSKMLIFSLNINVLLAVFNMIPIPPLDGGRVAVGLLPDALANPLARLERWGFVIIMGVFIILPFILSQISVDFHPFELFLKGPMTFVMKIILTLTGL